MISTYASLAWNPSALILLGGIISLAGTLWAANQQTVSERELRLKSEETLAFMVGSHEFEIKHQFSIVDGNDVLTLFLRNTAIQPSYSVTARIIDVDAYGAEEIQDMADLMKTPTPIYEKHWTDISPGAMSQALSLALAPNKRSLRFKIFLTSRKNRSNGILEFAKQADGNWLPVK